MFQSERQMAQEVIQQIADRNAKQGYSERELYRLEEKIIFSQSLLLKVTASQCVQADKDVLSITNYSKRRKRSLLLDIRELITYLDTGNALSGYLFSVQRIFAGRALKERLYILDDIYVNGHACNTKEHLELVKNVLTVDLLIHDLTQIWEVQGCSLASYVQQYQFFNFLLLEAIDLVQQLNLGSLVLENIKYELERQA